jgi:hypothetical protein
MTGHQHDDRSEFRRGASGADGVQPQWAARAVSARADDWVSGTLDPGDSHDKGEQSLCVGEAA